MTAQRLTDPLIPTEASARESWEKTDMECINCGWLRMVCHPMGDDPGPGPCHCGADDWRLFYGIRRDLRVLH